MAIDVLQKNNKSLIKMLKIENTDGPLRKDGRFTILRIKKEHIGYLCLDYLDHFSGYCKIWFLTLKHSNP